MKKMFGKTTKVLLVTVFVLVCISIVSMKTAKAAITIYSPSEGDRIELAEGSGSTTVAVNVRPCTVFPYTQVPGGSLLVPRYLCARITLNGEKLYYSRFKYDSTAIIQFDLPVKAPGTYRMDFRTDIPVQKNVSGGIEFHYQLMTEEQFLSGTPETSVSFVAYRPGADSAAGSGSSAGNEKVTLSKLKSVKLTALSAKKLRVSWKKLSSKDQKKIQKIQIQYSKDKTFKTGVKTKWAKKGKTSYTISGLKKNTKYYVRIRAYKKSGNIIYVSKWITKNKKTKK